MFRIHTIEIENFKAIKSVKLELKDFTVIVGTNGSGKSSVLQAVHWMLQSARNKNVKSGLPGKGSTLSALDAAYMPSPDYKDASHSLEYGNAAKASKMTVRLFASAEDMKPQKSEMWIKSAKNEGISVHVPSKSQITEQIKSSQREISAYIPGLAGIPLSEEKRSKRVVERLAAARDANTVLRNVLHLLAQETIEKNRTKLNEVERLVSSTLGPLSLEVSFNETEHYRIQAYFQTESMRQDDSKRFKPLELAGIGFLQVIQIFAYLVYFKPALLLVDEPDSHLHPDVQERLGSGLTTRT